MVAVMRTWESFVAHAARVRIGSHASRVRYDSGLQILQHFAERNKSLTANVLDLQCLEEPAAEFALEVFDRAGRGARERDRAAGAAVVAAGAAHLADHLPEDFAGTGVLDRRPHRQHER